jgi:hypothetical protein
MYTLLPRFNINYIQYAENICICLPKLCPFPALRFVTHISICHSFLGPRERRLHPFRMDCLTAMGWCGTCGDGRWWVVGCGWQSAECPRLLSSTQILFFLLHKIKHKPIFTLYFTPSSKSTTQQPHHIDFSLQLKFYSLFLHK